MPEPICPFDGTPLDRYWKDCDGYTMCICPECDARFHADAWVKDAPEPLSVEEAEAIRARFYAEYAR